MFEVAFALGESYDVRISPDERTVLAIATNRVERWDVASGTRTASTRVVNVGSADYSPDGSRILAGTCSGGCVLLDAETLAELARVPG